MFILKLIGKIVLLPVWVTLVLVWLAVHLVVELFGLFYGFWKLFFTIFIVIALGFGMWQNAIIMGVAILAVLAVFFAGAFIDALLSTARDGVGHLIIGGSVKTADIR